MIWPVLEITSLKFHLIQERSISILYNLFRDSLILYDGDSTSALMIGKPEYCGNLIPNNQKSSTNSVLIHFKSDPSVTKSGFKLKYQGFDQNSGK